MNRRVLVCSPVLPEFDRESGSRRIYDCVTHLHHAGWSVTFVARDGAGGDRYRAALLDQGIACYEGLEVLTPRFLDQARFDAAILAFWGLAETVLPRLRQATPQTRILVDSIDLHFLRRSRQVFGGVARGDRTTMLDLWFGDELVRELNTYAAADGVLTVSAKEASLVDDFVSQPGLARVVPDVEDLAASPPAPGQRAGILFTGNFRHGPNAEAVEYLCRDIVPRLGPETTAHHPVYIVGNALGERARRSAAANPEIRLVGWVPSVAPYLARARVAVVPLLNGAGTKRKLLQAMAAGTPAVSTPTGVEGLGVEHEREVLVADGADEFAAAVERLLSDDELWRRLAKAGRAYVEAHHGRTHAGLALDDALSAAAARAPKPTAMAEQLGEHRPNQRYELMVQRLGEVLRRRLPGDVSVLMVSKGDDALVALDGVRAAHFPGNDSGGYLGWHPPDSDDAVARLEVARQSGAQFLVIPEPSLWWLEHYAGLRAHLDAHYALAFTEEDTCVAYSLTPPTTRAALDEGEHPASTARTSGGRAPSDRVIDALRPVAGWTGAPGPSSALGDVLAIGVYLAGQETNVTDVVRVLGEQSSRRVTQRWIALGGEPPSPEVAAVTCRTVLERTPKYQLFTELLAGEDLDGYGFVLMVDDDIVLPHGFVDGFVGIQEAHALALAQPARTLNSYVDHPIVVQQPGVVLRQTRFVEIGPVVCVQRSAFDVVFPFDLTSPMGWGYENVWSYELDRRGLRIGIVDAVPVDHSLRPPVANYDWATADAQRTAYWGLHPHTPLEECFQVVDIVAARESVRSA